MTEAPAREGTIPVIPINPVHIHGMWTFSRPARFAARVRSTDAHLVHLVTHGGYRLILSGRTWPIEAPMLIWYHGAEAVTWSGDPRSVRFLSCAFSSPTLAPPPAGARVRTASPAIRPAFDRLWRAASGDGLRGALAFQASACAWLEALLDAYAIPDSANLWDQVERHALSVGERRSITALAAWAGTSASTLERACRDRHGCPPGVRLRQLRLAQAEALAAHGGLAKPQVAKLVGYSDQRSLRRAQRRGHRPGA